MIDIEYVTPEWIASVPIPDLLRDAARRLNHAAVQAEDPGYKLACALQCVTAYHAITGVIRRLEAEMDVEEAR